MKRALSASAKSRAGTAYVVLAGVFWGLSGGIAGLLMANGWHPLTVSFYRGLIGLLFVSLWLLVRPRESGLGNARLWLWSVLAGVGVSANFAMYFLSIERASVSVAATLMYCAPLFVYVVSFTLGIERSTLFKWAAMGTALVGIALLTRILQVDANGLSAMGIAAGLAAGVGYALFIFAFRSAARHGSPQTVLVIAFTVLAATLGVAGDPADTAAAWQSPDWPLFVLLGVLGAGLSFILFIRGIRHTAPALASVMAMAEPVTATLFGVMLLDETLAAGQLLGLVMILLAVTSLTAYSGGRYRYGNAARQ